MVPYADYLYFSLLVYPTIVAIALGLTGRLSWRWVLAISFAVLAIQYSRLPLSAPQNAVGNIRIVATYVMLQWGIAKGFLWLRRRRKDKATFRAAIVTALLPLMAVKFLPLAWSASAVAFLGISYVTFRSLDVIICIQDRLITSLPTGPYLAFLLFFPTISSGPIDRYNRFVADFARRRTRAEFLKDLDGAVHRVFRGFLYAFILAPLIKQFWLDPASKGVGLTQIISYMYAYTFYLFFDFAGYSAFAIAFSYLLGIHTPENFNRPFLASSIVDFWNRWHISLSAWFRDHIYMRFIMASMRGGWFRSRALASSVAFYVSFGLMGLWHGTAPHYIIYGFYHATLLSGATIMSGRRREQPPTQARRIANTFITFHLVSFGLLIFSGRLG
jgi:membrane protein involved in D-alanine export